MCHFLWSLFKIGPLCMQCSFLLSWMRLKDNAWFVHYAWPRIWKTDEWVLHYWMDTTCNFYRCNQLCPIMHLIINHFGCSWARYWKWDEFWEIVRCPTAHNICMSFYMLTSFVWVWFKYVYMDRHCNCRRGLGLTSRGISYLLSLIVRFVVFTLLKQNVEHPYPSGKSVEPGNYRHSVFFLPLLKSLPPAIIQMERIVDDWQMHRIPHFDVAKVLFYGFVMKELQMWSANWGDCMAITEVETKKNHKRMDDPQRLSLHTSMLCLASG